MKRICLALDMVDDTSLIEEYEDWHKNVWPEILDSLRSSGIENMEIYRTGNRLVMILEVEDDFTLERKASMDQANPKVQEWESLMSKFQQRLPWAREDEKWVKMKLVFKL